jgi:hypothetical protein
MLGRRLRLPAARRPVRHRAAATVVAGVFAIAFSLATVAVSRWVAADAAHGPARCAEVRLATATGFRHDPGLALAVSRTILTTSPELAGIVDAVADHQRAYPDVASLVVGPGMAPGEPSLVFLAVMIDLSGRPDLATPAVVATLERAAASGGFAGVHELIVGTGPPPDDDRGGRALAELRRLVRQQRGAVAAAGLASLPDGACREA